MLKSENTRTNFGKEKEDPKDDPRRFGIKRKMSWRRMNPATRSKHLNPCRNEA